jgi:hypothetical protein
MSGNNINLKFERRAMPLIGALGRWHKRYALSPVA